MFFGVLSNELLPFPSHFLLGQSREKKCYRRNKTEDHHWLGCQYFSVWQVTELGNAFGKNGFLLFAQ